MKKGWVIFIALGISLMVLAIPQLSLAKEATGEDATLSIEAWDYYYDKEFDQAIDLFNKEADLHFDWCDGYDGLGWSYLQKGNFLKAEESFKKALKIYAYYQNSLTGLAEVEAWKYRPFNRAWGYYYTGNLDKAVELFSQALSETDRLPKDEIWRAHLGLGWSFFGKRDFDRAIEEFNGVLKVKRDNAEPLRGLGMAYFEKEDLDNSLTNLNASLKIAAYQADLHATLGWIYNKRENFKKAIEEFEEAKKLNPYLVEPYRGLAWTYFDMQDEAKAKEAFIQGIKIYPGYVADEKFKEVLKGKAEWKDIYKTLAWSYYNYALYQQAQEEFQNAAKETGEDAETLRGLGYSLSRLGKYDEAIKYLKKSLAMDPNLEPVEEYVQVPGTYASYLIKSDAQSTLAWCLYYKEDYRNAAGQFKSALENNPTWLDAHDGLGWSYFMLKDYTNAEKAFRDALSYNVYYADAVNGITAINQLKYGKSGLGWSYFYRGDYKSALKHFDEAIKGGNFPKEQVWSLHSGMGWSYYWLGKPDSAEKEFRLVLNEMSNNVDAMVGMGYVLFQKKNYNEAKNKLEEVLKIAPNNYDALTTLGWSYYRTGDFPKAIDTFKKALAINVYLADPYLGLGLSYYENKNIKEAKDAIGIAIDIYPDYAMTDNVKEVLRKDDDWADLYSRFGWSYYYKGLFDKASNMFAANLNNDRNSSDAALGLGAIYFQQADYKATINKLEPLLSGKPKEEKGWLKWSYVLSNLGWSHYYLGNYEKAMDYFKEALNLHANDDIYAEPYSGLGWVLLKKGSRNTAKEQFLKAVKLAPGYLSAVNGLAELERMR